MCGLGILDNKKPAALKNPAGAISWLAIQVNSITLYEIMLS